MPTNRCHFKCNILIPKYTFPFMDRTSIIRTCKQIIHYHMNDFKSVQISYLFDLNAVHCLILLTTMQPEKAFQLPSIPTSFSLQFNHFSTTYSFRSHKLISYRNFMKKKCRLQICCFFSRLKQLKQTMHQWQLHWRTHTNASQYIACVCDVQQMLDNVVILLIQRCWIFSSTLKHPLWSFVHF